MFHEQAPALDEPLVTLWGVRIAGCGDWHARLIQDSLWVHGEDKYDPGAAAVSAITSRQLRKWTAPLSAFLQGRAERNSMRPQ
jgi:hypothetical protein